MSIDHGDRSAIDAGLLMDLDYIAVIYGRVHAIAADADADGLCRLGGA